MSKENTMEELKRIFAPPAARRENNQYYWFGNIPLDKPAEIRFVRDANPKNVKKFIIEKRVHKLIINGEKKNVPCAKTLGHDDCPICKISREFYNREGKTSVNGKKYYRKLYYLAAALILKDPLAYAEDAEPATGKIKVIQFDSKLYKLIQDALTTGELDDWPMNYDNGTNFLIKRTMNGEWSEYILSKFAKRSTALTDEQIEYCEQNLIDLSSLLAKKEDWPLEKIEAMLKASLTNSEYVGDDGSGPAEMTFVPRVKEDKPTMSDDYDDDDDEESKAILESLINRKNSRATG